MGLALTAIRPMAADDLDEVVAMEARSQPRPWSEKVFSDELAAGNRVYLVAEDGDDHVVGFGGVMVIEGEAHVTNLLVDERFRGKGVGKQLMVSLIEASVGCGARHLTLEVRKENAAARALYSRLGMAPVGLRPRYYGNDDALILWAHDIDDPEFLERLT